MYRFKPRLLLSLVLGAAALAVAPHALAAQSYFDAACEQGEVASESSDAGDVVYDANGIDLASRASELSLRARATVDGLNAQHLRYCDVVTTFANTLTVKPGTTGLAPGAPVTLAFGVGLDGDLAAGYNGPGQPEQEPASFIAEAAFNGLIDMTLDGQPVAHFSAHADQREWASSPDAYYPNGVVVTENKWNWELTGNRGGSLGNQDNVVSQLCDAWPVVFPCVASTPLPPIPDFQGMRTILVDAHVGDTLAVDGQLTILPQAAQAQARAAFPAGLTGGSGLRAFVKPADGFEGLTLDLEVGPAQAGPALSIGDASVTEGDSGTKQLSFPVHLSHASDEPVTVSYETFNGTATQPADYAQATGTLTFAPGETDKTITVDVVGDTVAEADESFQVVLNAPRHATVADGAAQGTILDDDGSAARPTLTVNDSEVLEGTDGTIQAGITVSLSAPAKANVTFDYATADGTAKAPGDYTSTSGHVVIPVGQTGVTMLVPIVGDTEPEPAETLDVVLSNVQGATVAGSGRGTLTIDDDDAGCTPKLAYDYVEATGCFVPDNGSFVAAGPVHVNGLELVADRGVDILVDPAHRRVYSRSGDVSVLVGDDVIWKGTIDWLTPTLGPKSSVHVANLPAALTDGFKVRGLPIPATESVEFDLDRQAHVTIPLRIPFVDVVIDGVNLTGQAVLVTDNARGLHSDSIRVTADPVVVPPITIRQLAIAWDGLRQRWEGSGTLVLPTPEALSISAGVAFENGQFAGASGGVDNLNLPIGNGVYVQAIRFSLEFEPLKVGGGIGISAGPVVDGKTAIRLDGDFSVDFGDPFTVEAHGTLKLVDFPLASAWFRYLGTGTVQFGGTVAIGLPDPSNPGKQPVHLVASVGGWVNGAVGFAAEGSADVAVFGVPVVGADLLVSNLGAAACGHIAWLKAGFGYRWDTGELSVMGDNCDVGAFAPVVPVGVAAATSAAATATTFRLPKSDDGVVLRLHGSTGAPAVTLTGPAGRTVDTPTDADASLVNDEFVVLKDEASKTTIVAIRHPAGTWTVAPRAGSPAVTSVEQASVAPDPQVTADVRGDAHAPTLTWKTHAQPGQTVTFAEHAQDVDAVIARTTDAKGSVSFTPAAGPAGPRDIVAVVEQDGMPRLQTVVAHYDAPDTAEADVPAARKALRGLQHDVVGAHLDAGVQQALVDPLRAARRALKPPTPDVATACARVGDFVSQVAQATGPSGIPPAQAAAWTNAATGTKQLLRCG
jgi:hypothetical protein